MSEVAAFSRYVGLVVVLFAMALVVPRMTVAAWNGLLAGIRSRWRSILAWRPGTIVAERHVVPVEVRVGERRASDADELLEAGGLPGLRHATSEIWFLARERLEAGALALAALGLLLRTFGSLLQELPEGLVLTADLLLVLGAFLIMQRTIRDYPISELPQRLADLVRPHRVAGKAVDRPAGRARHLLEMVVLAPAFLALLAWPVEIGRFVAEKQFTGPQSTVLVVWACELPWLVAVAWWLARPLLPPMRRRPKGRHAAPVVVLRRRQEPIAEQRKAA